MENEIPNIIYQFSKIYLYARFKKKTSASYFKNNTSCKLRCLLAVKKIILYIFLHYLLSNTNDSHLNLLLEYNDDNSPMKHLLLYIKTNFFQNS